MGHRADANQTRYIRHPHAGQNPNWVGAHAFHHLFLATFIGAYIWYILLIGIGYLPGNKWTLITAYLKQSLPFLLAGSAFALALYAWFTRRHPGYALVRWNDE